MLIAALLPRSAKKTTLADLLAQTRNKTFQYVYDFGDDWRHTIKLEALAEAESNTLYPRLLSAQGRCPPEAVGGPGRYAQYLEAIADPDHELHAEMVEWRGPDFDPNAVDEASIQKQLSRLAPRPRRKPKTAARAVSALFHQGLAGFDPRHIRCRLARSNGVRPVSVD